MLPAIGFFMSSCCNCRLFCAILGFVVGGNDVWNSPPAMGGASYLRVVWSFELLPIGERPLTRTFSQANTTSQYIFLI